jgi:hypothetical protein
MFHTKRLKTGNPIYTFIPAIFSLGMFAFSAMFFGPELAFKILGAIILAYGAISFGFYYLKTRSYIYLVSSSYLFTFGIVLLTIRLAYAGRPDLVFPPVTRFFLVWMILLWIWLFILMVSKQTMWKGNNILELAAIGVESSENAYTERPFPVRTIDYDKNEILALSKFLARNLTCIPYVDNGKIYLVPVNNKSALQLFYQPGFNFIEKTWVSFDEEGQVSVHISRESYLSFKQNLALDQLCMNLGNLFIDFLEDYRKGEGVRITDKLKSVKTDFFA